MPRERINGPGERYGTMRSYIRLVLGSTIGGNEWRRRDRENSSGRRITSRKKRASYVSFVSPRSMYRSYRSNSNYSKTSPRASQRSILILRLNYWHLTRISIALLGDRVISIALEIDFVSFKME